MVDPLENWGAIMEAVRHPMSSTTVLTACNTPRPASRKSHAHVSERMGFERDFVPVLYDSEAGPDLYPTQHLISTQPDECMVATGMSQAISTSNK